MSEPNTVKEVDKILERMHAFLESTAGRPKTSMRLSLSDVQWVVAEIEAGREAFGQVVRELEATKHAKVALEENHRALLQLHAARPQTQSSLSSGNPYQQASLEREDHSAPTK